MAAIVWNRVENRFFEDGLDRGVLYPLTGSGVAWSGLVSVEEAPVGGDATPVYYDGTKYLDIMGNEDFSATISALSAPDEFMLCDGTVSLVPGLFATQQPRQTFGFSYRTLVGDGLKGIKRGYKIHVVYNATASPSGRTSKTLTNAAAPDPRAWTINCVPGDPGSLLIKPTAHIIIDSTKSNPTALAAVEGLLYGTASAPPQLPSQTVFTNLLRT